MNIPLRCFLPLFAVLLHAAPGLASPPASPVQPHVARMRPASFTGTGRNALLVPSQYPTIQAAVNASQDGDTVLVADGTYTGDGNRDIDFNGKNIIVTSQNGPTKTIIDCGGYASTDGSGNHRGFSIHSGETNATVSGFTIRNGYETFLSGIPDSGLGGGVYNYNFNSGTITVNDCILTKNTAAGGGGGGIYNSSSNGSKTIITNCSVTGNSARRGYPINIIGGADGGGICNGNSNGGTITLTNCTITENTALFYVTSSPNSTNHGKTALISQPAVVGDHGDGGGIYNNSGGTTILTNCTITENTAQSSGSGIFNSNNNGGTTTLTNDIFYGDTGGGEVWSYNTSKVPVLFSDIQGGYPGTGNIDADPLFVNAAAGDLHLMPGSTCLGAGTPYGAPATDLDGNPRPDPPSIGAYELAVTPVTIHLSSARMVSSHQLSIQTSRVFGTGTYPVTVTATINGQPATETQMLPGNGSTDSNPFVFDLSALNVPRFTKNERFTVTATVAAPSGNVSDSRDVVIWLPTVLVPGINGLSDLTGNPDHPAGGDGTFPQAEATLEQASQSFLNDNNCLGEPYNLFSPNNSYEYPTLTTLSYDRDNDSFATGAAKLNNLLGLVKLYTYADKVNLVTHSKGGLVARAYLQYKANQIPPVSAGTVNRLIMTVPPNTGCAWAKLDVIGFGIINYNNLYPLWPWYRTYLYQQFIGFGAPNFELSALDGTDQSLPPAVKYTIIYSDKYPTPETLTTKPLVAGTILGVPVPPLVGVTVGDSVVPYYSQEGFQYNPNTPNAQFAMIPPFQGVLINHMDIAGYHTAVPGLQSVSYLDLPAVDSEVFSEIEADF